MYTTKNRCSNALVATIQQYREAVFLATPTQQLPRATRTQPQPLVRATRTPPQPKVRATRTQPLPKVWYPEPIC
jgi:hypothetical protein